MLMGKWQYEFNLAACRLNFVLNGVLDVSELVSGSGD